MAAAICWVTSACWRLVECSVVQVKFAHHFAMIIQWNKSHYLLEEKRMNNNKTTCRFILKMRRYVATALEAGATQEERCLSPSTSTSGGELGLQKYTGNTLME